MITKPINKVKSYILTYKGNSAVERDLKFFEDFRKDETIMNCFTLCFYYNTHKEYCDTYSNIKSGFYEMLAHAFEDPETMYAAFFENDCGISCISYWIPYMLMQVPINADILYFGTIPFTDKTIFSLCNNNILSIKGKNCVGFHSVLITRLGYEKYIDSGKAVNKSYADWDYSELIEHNIVSAFHTIPAMFHQKQGFSGTLKRNTGIRDNKKIYKALNFKTVSNTYNTLRKSNGNRLPHFIECLHN